MNIVLLFSFEYGANIVNSKTKMYMHSGDKMKKSHSDLIENVLGENAVKACVSMRVVASTSMSTGRAKRLIVA